MSALEVAQARTPLDRAVVQGEGDAVDLDQRRTYGDAEFPRRFGIGSSGRKTFIGSRHQHTVGLLEDVVESVRNFGEIRKAWKGGLGQGRRLCDEWFAVADADAIDANDIGIFRQLERLAFRLVGFAKGAPQASAVGDDAGAGVLEQVEKAKQNIAGVCSKTNVPRPCRRTTRFSAARAPMALRAVPWLTLNSAAISNSLGMSWPGFQRPSECARRVGR